MLLLALFLITFASPETQAQESADTGLRSAFVQYEVTWFRPPKNFVTNEIIEASLWEVNSRGIGVGWYNELGNGGYKAVILNRVNPGSIELISDVFEDALAPYSEYEWDGAIHINNESQIVLGLGKPDVNLICLLKLSDRSLKVIDRINGCVNVFTTRFSENGDLIYNQEPCGPGGWEAYYLRRFPFTDPPLVFASENEYTARGFNSAGQIALRKPSSRTEGIHSVIQEPDGTLTDLGTTIVISNIDENGYAYGNAYFRASDDRRPFRWKPETGWHALLPEEARTQAVSRDASITEVLLTHDLQDQDEAEPQPLWVHREGYGTYPVEVVAGRTGINLFLRDPDLDLWNDHVRNRNIFAYSISSRNGPANAGYICGEPNQIPSTLMFILSPIAENVDANPDASPLDIQSTSDVLTVTWPGTVPNAVLETSQDLINWEEPQMFYDREQRRYAIPHTLRPPSAYFRLRWTE